MARDSLEILVNPGDSTIEAKIDLVAVHGLNPFNKDDHATKTWSKEGKLWLKDFLPERLPNARIMLLSYDANLAFGKSCAGVSDYAEKLLGLLSLKRETDPHRPLVFICHSLGGIVVKKALVEATSGHQDREWNDIRNATYGLVFFGTPHDGSDFANLGRIAVKIARALFKTPNSSLVEALRGNSLFTDELQRNFRHRLEDVRFLSFFEGETKMNQVIVNRKSATFGLPAQREKAFPIPLDHSAMCKFAAKDDPDYEFVAGYISRMCKDAVAAREVQMRLETLMMDTNNVHAEPRIGKIDVENARGSIRSLDATRQQKREDEEKARHDLEELERVRKLEELNQIRDDCLRGLYYPQMSLRYDNIEAERVKDDVSTSPFFQTQQFHSWNINPSCDAVLSLKGEPGSGKSVLMKRTTQHFKALDQKLGSQLTLSFFFTGNVQDGQSNLNSSCGMYRTLLYQLIENWEKPSPDFLRGVRSRAILASGDPWTSDNLQRWLRQGFTACSTSYRRILIFLDALDEWDAEDCKNHLGLSFLTDFIQNTGIHFSICSSSRYHPATYWNTPTQQFIVNIENFNKIDMAKFLEQETKASETLNEEQRKFVISTLMAKANHNFMWLVLAHGNILGHAALRSQEELEEYMRQVPSDLFDLYASTLRRLPNHLPRPEVLFLFQMVAYAQEVLSKEELIDAFSICLYPNDWKKRRSVFNTGLDFAKWIGQLSGGLIQIKNTGCPNLRENLATDLVTVQFTHETVRTFLTQKMKAGKETKVINDTEKIDEPDTGLKILDPSLTPEACHQQLFKVCLRYFECDTMDGNQELHLKQYATTFWMTHASGCNAILNDNINDLPAFLEQCIPETQAVVDLYQENLDRRVMLGTVRPVVSLRRERRLLVLLASEGCTELMYRHRQSCLSCIKATQPGLLNDALYQAVEHNRKETVSCIVERLNCNLLVSYGRSNPLYRACYKGLLDMVILLLSLGADPYLTSNQNYRTAFNAAVGNGYRDILKGMLSHPCADKGCLLQGTDDEGQTPIHIAIKGSCDEVIDILLKAVRDSREYGVLRVANSEGKTPHDVAVDCNNSLAIRKLETCAACENVGL